MMIRVRLMAWFKRFVDPLILPDGRELLTLREVQLYVDAYNRKKAAAEAITMLVDAQTRNAVWLNAKDN